MSRRLATKSVQYKATPAAPSPGKDVPGVRTSARKRTTARARKTYDSLRRSNDSLAPRGVIKLAKKAQPNIPDATENVQRKLGGGPAVPL